jgi:hypothetical protein
MNALVNEFVAPTMSPVTPGATNPAVPTLPSAMRPESDLSTSAWPPHAPLLQTPSFAAAWAEGRAMTLEQAIEYALAEGGEASEIGPG